MSLLVVNETIIIVRGEHQNISLDFSQHSAVDYTITVTVLPDACANIMIQAPRAQNYNLRVIINLESHSEAHCWIVEELAQSMRGTITTRQQHNAPHAKSTVIVRSVLRDAAQSSYYGIIRIEEAARGAVAVQNSATLLLGAAVKTEATPSLEILTDDVSCKHGSSCGTISQEHLFYLQTRGITVTAATELLVAGFLDEVRSKLIEV